MSGNIERLYDLLPIIYRQLDLKRSEATQKGPPLRAFMAVLQHLYSHLEENIATLYGNWFIETCEQWCIPYIGELIGMRDLTLDTGFPGGRRALVANTVGYRRRKGTIDVLSNVIRDATGWRAMAVEFSRFLSVTQAMNHVRPHGGRTIDLKNLPLLERLDTPFDTAAHGADIRGVPMRGVSPLPRPDVRRGKYNIPNIGIFLWRLPVYPVTMGRAFNNGSGRFTFNPMGVAVPLFNLPETPSGADREPREANLPTALLRNPWFLSKHGDANDYPPAFNIYFRKAPDLEFNRLDLDKMHIRKLPPLVGLEAANAPEQPGKTRAPYDGAPVQADIDPVNGQIQFRGNFRPHDVRVDYSYAFSADIGGGPYMRPEQPEEPRLEKPWTGIVYSGLPRQLEGTREKENTFFFSSLEAALGEWKKKTGGMESCTIRIIDNATYTLPTGPISLTAAHLVIGADPGQCPCLVGNLSLHTPDAGSKVELNGIWLDGTVTLDGPLQFSLLHSTLRPRTGAPLSGASLKAAAGGHPGLMVALSHSITGPLQLPADIQLLEIKHSIIDGLSGYAVSSARVDPRRHDGGPEPFGPPAIIDTSTFLGPVSLRRLEAATGVLFAGPLKVKNPNTGYIRYSYLPSGSRSPVNYQCLTGMPQDNTGAFFTSRHYGQPGYVQLGPGCPPEVKTGAENGAEIGAFNHLHHPQRQESMDNVLKQYFPYGLKPEVFYVT